MNFNLRRFVSPKVGAAVASLPVLLLPLASNAAFTVPTEITDSQTNVALVGGAVFTIMVGIKLYKWLRRAL